MNNYRLQFILVTCLLTLTGCQAIDFYTPAIPAPLASELQPPREMAMVSLPSYRIAPPDVLRVEVTKLVPRPSYRIGEYDVLRIDVLGAFKDRPINNAYLVEPEGIVTLGPPYGVVRLEGLTVEEAEAAIVRSLELILKNPRVCVRLLKISSAEQLTNAYPVEPDGVIRLKGYGAVHVAGLNVTEASLAVQRCLEQYFDSPKVGIDVTQYNSAAYYIVCGMAMNDGNVWRYPITGNETVLDAIGASGKAGKITGKTVWVVRPAKADQPEQILPVNWNAVICGARTTTNYQILPGDRIYIADENVVSAHRLIVRVTAPLERLLGITYQGESMIYTAETLGRDYNVNRND